LYSFEAIGAACGGEAAFGAKKRGDGTLVKADNGGKQYGEQLAHPKSKVKSENPKVY
jgi:hypothetical protein